MAMQIIKSFHATYSFYDAVLVGVSGWAQRLNGRIWIDGVLQQSSGGLVLPHPPHAKQTLVQVQILLSNNSFVDGRYKPREETHMELTCT